MNRRTFLIASVTALLASSPSVADQNKSFVLATTTSTENSGLLDAIIPDFEAKTGISIDVVAVGTGQALALGRAGDAAALLTHDRMGEDEFVAAGHGTDRRDVMYNDFIIIGPRDDPANLKQAARTEDAFDKIARSGAVFVSRGDDSGTNRKEIRLWQSAGQDAQSFGAWYRETGAGMGQTIITTTELGGYTLTDRATWTKFKSKADHIITFEEDPPLFNPYSSILVTNANLPSGQAKNAEIWHNWLTSPDGQKAISDYRVDGQQLFFIGDPQTNG